MIFGTIKNYALAGLAAVVGILAVALKFVGARSRKLEIEKDYLDAVVHRDREIMNRDNELEAQTASRRAKAKRDNSIARNPNQLWEDDADDS